MTMERVSKLEVEGFIAEGRISQAARATGAKITERTAGLTIARWGFLVGVIWAPDIAAITFVPNVRR